MIFEKSFLQCLVQLNYLIARKWEKLTNILLKSYKRNTNATDAHNDIMFLFDLLIRLLFLKNIFYCCSLKRSVDIHEIIKMAIFQLATASMATPIVSLSLSSLFISAIATTYLHVGSKLLRSTNENLSANLWNSGW